MELEMEAEVVDYSRGGSMEPNRPFQPEASSSVPPPDNIMEPEEVRRNIHMPRTGSTSSMIFFWGENRGHQKEPGLTEQVQDQHPRREVPNGSTTAKHLQAHLPSRLKILAIQSATRPASFRLNSLHQMGPSCL